METPFERAVSQIGSDQQSEARPPRKVNAAQRQRPRGCQDERRGASPRPRSLRAHREIEGGAIDSKSDKR